MQLFKKKNIIFLGSTLVILSLLRKKIVPSLLGKNIVLKVLRAGFELTKKNLIFKLW